MLVKDTLTNHYGDQTWKLHAPDGLEIGVYLGKTGISFGGELIPWNEIDEARKEAEAFSHDVQACPQCGMRLCKCTAPSDNGDKGES